MNPLHHYSFESVPTIFDEEALTVLELCARLAGKVNELIKGHNDQDELIKSLYSTELTKQVSAWLEAHPEVTTTVQDGALSLAKFITGELGYVTPQLFGAKANGVEDDTQAINMALACINDKCQKLYIPSGTYLVSEDINLPSDMTIYGDGVTSVIKRAPNSLSNYAVLTAGNTVNVTIKDLTVQGERNEHTGTGGEWGICIRLMSATNTVIDNVVMRDGWGDGLYLGHFSDNNNPNANTLVRNCTMDNNRRNGVSIIHADGLTFENCRLTNTNGTAPEAGIDFEVNHADEIIHNVIMRGCVFSGNASKDWAVANTVTDYQLRMEDCTFRSSVGVSLTANPADTTGGYALFRNCIFQNAYRCMAGNTTPGDLFVHLDNCDLWSDSLCVDIGSTTLSGYESNIGGLHIINTRFHKNGTSYTPVRICTATAGKTLEDIVLDIHLNEGIAKKYLYTYAPVAGHVRLNTNREAVYGDTNVSLDCYGVYDNLVINVATGRNVTCKESFPYNCPVTIRNGTGSANLFVKLESGNFPQYDGATKLVIPGKLDEVVVTHISEGIWKVEDKTIKGITPTT